MSEISKKVNRFNVVNVEDRHINIVDKRVDSTIPLFNIQDSSYYYFETENNPEIFDKTLKIFDSVYVDFDKDGNVFGIELFCPLSRVKEFVKSSGISLIVKDALLKILEFEK